MNIARMSDEHMRCCIAALDAAPARKTREGRELAEALKHAVARRAMEAR